MVFPVTLRDVPNEVVTLSYSSPKGSGSVTIAAGQTSGEIKIPVTGDTQKEADETFTLTVKDQNGKLFADCKGTDSAEATGTIIDDDDIPKPPEPKKNPHEFNDPRYITIDGKSLEFQAAGEFTLLESLNDDYKIQIRQQPVGNDPLKNASNATAVATILGGKRVGLYQDSQQLLIDGIPTTIPDNEYIFVGEGRIYREGNRYSFVYPKGDQLIATMSENRINVSLFLSPERRDTVRGIFGTYNDNPDDDLIKSDGTVLTSPISPEQLYGEYADSWRVGQTESLFDYQPGEDTNKFTISNYPRKKVKLSDLDPADIQKAEELIGDRITDPTIRETAIIDLVLTDFDPEVIEAAINVPSPQSSVIIRVDPEAKADFTSTFANTPVKINPLTNDIVTTGIPLSLTGYDQTTAKGGTIQLDNNGTPDDKTDDQLIYTPSTNFVGVDTINYVIADDQKTATGTITVAVPAINLNALNGDNGFAVTGAAGTFAGSSLSNIGDFNGDTIDDFIVGGFAADPNNINATGESYVVFGTNQGFPANFDLSTLNGTNGFIIEGFEAESFSGGAVSSAGDINGDGLKDLIIGAFASDSNSLNDSGRTYVVLGSNQPFSTRFNLANLRRRYRN
ncbi:VWD domain-containing protein [Planktothrix agardhii 1806]|jgi:von Willebrand factor type D domain/Bacterial Ig domain/FG-GAP repeat|uniref:VWD domain-containing protein n=1 Tax=Planktothrix agardhii TaxID=1160 RepID=UPI001F274E47|nr:VWD domain-containing protein [Planktothrix agardhii]MCF3569225.1 VWD domain-containing protein [Planktothrix agardhii 1807]MCF3570468.1 VWD domain-containing protein [Planktothrix agardhii 1805]MCF3586483.1 VWD domain-containing protein [Planktothrix agardhii 1803]MCF3603349.1 VWD domain-containing protein [Planktothrix agardhii 1804]MCF3615743.1 VWD domain-containing protein [Planktothrix agardhii 1806]